MLLISAKQELEEVFNVKLTTEDKLEILKIMQIELDNDLYITNRKQRTPRLARKQIIDECVDIFEKYLAIERAKDND